MFHVDSAPTLSDRFDTQDEVSYSSVPPNQGKTQAITNVSRGAGKRDSAPGFYAFGESIETEDGVIRPGPQVVQTVTSGGGALDGVIVAHTFHSDGKVWIAAGQKVYRWNATNQNWEEPAAQPGLAQAITDILSFSGKLYVFYGTTGKQAEWTSDNGATWFDVPGTTTGAQGRYAAILEQRSVRPKMIAVVDPDVTYVADDPTVLASWDLGSRVGQESTALDGFTSVVVAPDGALLLGKKTGWRTMDAFGKVDILYPAQPSAGLGMANFSRPVVGPKRRLYTVAEDYDIIEYDNGIPRPGFGVHRFGPFIPEMQKAIVALTGDGREKLYAALAGSEGYVMKGLYVDDGEEWAWHGAYIKVGVALTYMWMAVDPGDNQLYLWMAPSATPFRPYRALIPRGGLDNDTAARFAASANIRFGYHDNGFAHDTKVALQAQPMTRNLLSGTRSVELQYRADAAAGFSTIGTYVDGPEPSNTVDTYFPAGTSGKRIELKALLTNSSATGQVIIDRIIARYLTRHLRTNIITATILAERGQRSLTGARMDISGQGMKDDLNTAMKAVVPPTVTDSTGRVWTVDLVGMKEVTLKDGNMAFELTMLEIPTIVSIASSTGGVSHRHKVDSFTGAGTTVTLSSQPIGPVLLWKNDTFMVEGVGNDWTRSGTTVTFAADATGAAIRAEYPY